jgi:hypothetical protein
MTGDPRKGSKRWDRTNRTLYAVAKVLLAVAAVVTACQGCSFHW